MKITAEELKKLGIIDNIIEESNGESQDNFENVCKILKNLLLENIDKLLAISKENLLEQRYEKYRKIGGIL